MKKWTSFVAAIVIVFLLAGCSANANLSKEAQDSANQQPQQSVESDNQVSNENIPFTSLEELEEIYAVNWNKYGGGANTAGSLPELQQFVKAPVHITIEGFNSLSLEDRKRYTKILLIYMDLNTKELGLLLDNDGIKFEADEDSMSDYWLVTPETFAGNAGYFWPKDNHWGPEPFTPDTPKR
ncbi:hypothetical protein OXPF_38610 [Oxobacter pfennigii]|uniref:Lipoprotein n=1 Tax=Oxobacter pfennigii TaxID=36849 RepID=A0A0P8YSB9_9CLOT|nr:hypothetical protein [Oxobacter pfennigii]KPU42561.1 hypothetical protein OXPF_38610 [Oxobacter pfennigii]